MTSQPQYRILLVEDNPGDARLVREMVSAQSHLWFTLESAVSLHEAMTRLSQESFDVIVLDLGLPDSAGLETFHQLHQRHPNLPVLVLTGNSDDELGVKALQAGAQDYLVKGQIAGNALIRAARYAIERQTAELALRVSERRYRDVVEATGDGIWTIDADDRITSVNEQLSRLSGYGAGELLGESIHRFFAPSSVTEVGFRLSGLRDGIAQRAHLELIGKGGRALFVIVTATPVRDERGNYAGAIGAIIDLTERKAAEDAVRIRTESLLAANAELERFNRLAVGRELRMIDLKRRVNALCEELGRPQAYVIHEQSAETETS